MQLKTTFLLSFLFCYSYFLSQEINFKHDIKYAFIENKGQWNPNVLFKSKFDGGNLWVQNKKFVFHFQDFSALHKTHGNNQLRKGELNNLKNRQSIVHLNFKNSNNFRVTEKLNPSSNYYNYFIGNDESKWASSVRGYNQAYIKNIYNGVDLKLIEDNSKLKYEFHVSPNTPSDIIQLEFVGHEKISIDKNGDLHIQTEIGEVIEEKPYTYQIINGKIKEVECEFSLHNNIVTFSIGSYNKSEELIIDPTLVFATYSGSVTDNFGMTATYAHNGEAYSGGTIFGNQYPTPDNSSFNINSNFTVNQGAYGITDVFISKYSSDGTQMLWTNFIGGGDNIRGTETVHSLIADKEDNLYLYGATSSTDFPIVNGYQTVHAGGGPNLNFAANGVFHLSQGTDIFVSKISANGQQLIASTYIGGNDNDGVNYNSNLSYDSLMTNFGDNSRGEIMLDSIGNCIIASCTRSSNFPVLNAFQTTISGQQDGVIFMLNKNLSSIVWSSYFGGSKNDMINSVKIDSSFNIVFAGGTSSNDLVKTTNTWQSTYNGGNTDGYVGKLSSDGRNLLKVSYVGTPNYDNVFFTEIDLDGNIYLYGQSFGGSFPVVNSSFVNPNSNQFICKLDSSLTNLIKSTTFGNGDPTELNLSPSAFLVDDCGNIYVSGWGQTFAGLNGTPLTGMPVSPDALQSSPPNGHDFYIMAIDKDFSTLLYGSYLGGNEADEHVDGGTSRFDKDGIVYQSICGGCGGYSDFPTTQNAWSSSNLTDQRCNNIILKFDFRIKPLSIVEEVDTLICTNTEINFINNSENANAFLWDFGNNDTTSTTLNPSKTFDSSGVYYIKLISYDTDCRRSDSVSFQITVIDSVTFEKNENIFQCFPSPQILTANSFGNATSFIWSSSNLFNDTLNNSVSDSILSLDLDPGLYSFHIKYNNEGACFTTDSLIIHFPDNQYSIEGDNNLCATEEPTFNLVNNNPLIEYTHLWRNDSIIKTDPNLSNIVINPKTPQYLFIELTSDSGCVIIDSVFVNIGNLDTSLVKAFASDTLVPVGQTITLTALPENGQYSWEPSFQINTAETQTTKATVNKSSYFKVTVSDGICSASDSVFVKTFQYLCDDPSIFVPNAFSPNGDDNNDILYVNGNMIDKMIFRIFDRWGTLIFETKDRLEGWDGTYRGKKLDPDVYDYYLQATCIDNIESIIKGNITLLK